jgi:hypothetical protein
MDTEEMVTRRPALLVISAPILRVDAEEGAAACVAVVDVDASIKQL